MKRFWMVGVMTLLLIVPLSNLGADASECMATPMMSEEALPGALMTGFQNNIREEYQGSANLLAQEMVQMPGSIFNTQIEASTLPRFHGPVPLSNMPQSNYYGAMGNTMVVGSRMPAQHINYTVSPFGYPMESLPNMQIKMIPRGVGY